MEVGMKEVTVLVPEERLAEFYGMVARFHAGEIETTELVSEKRRMPWGEEDVDPARELLGMLSDPAAEFFSLMMDAPEQKLAAAEVADRLGLEKGPSGLAGVLAWPGRYCRSLGRELPWKWNEGEDGAALYWMTSDVSALFRKARDSE